MGQPSSFQRDGDVLRIEEDQEEGGIAFTEVVELAIGKGFTQVETGAGWIGLKAWTPYGKTEHHSVIFHLSDKEIVESLSPGARGYNLPAILGIWPIR